MQACPNFRILRHIALWGPRSENAFRREWDAAVRTNSEKTTFTVDDGSTGKVYHYGVAGIMDVVQCHTGSLYAHGAIGYTDLAKGRIVLTEDSDLDVINVKRKDANTYYNPIIADGGVLPENMPEIISRDQVEVTGSEGKTPLVQIQKTDEEGEAVEGSATEQVYAYANGAPTAGSTVQVTEGDGKQNEAVTSALGKIVLDSGSDAGEYAYSESQQTAKMDEMASDAISAEVSEKDPTGVARIGYVGYPTLKKAYDDAEEGDHIVLLANIELDNTFTIAKNLTIDGKHGDERYEIKFLTPTNVNNGFELTKKDSSIRFQNVDIWNASSANYARAICVYASGINLVVDHCDVTSTMHTAIRTGSVYVDQSITISDCHLKGWCGLQLWSCDSTIIVNRTTIDTVNRYSGPTASYGGIVFECDYGGTEIESTTLYLNDCAMKATPEGIADHDLIVYKCDTANNTTYIDGGSIDCLYDDFIDDQGSKNNTYVKNLVYKGKIDTDVYTITTDEEGYEKVTTGYSYFFQVGDAYYKTIEEAIEATTETDKVIKLTHNSEGIHSVISVTSGDFIFDINGFECAYASINVSGSAHMTIIDSRLEEGTGLIHFDGDFAGNIVVESGAFYKDPTAFVDTFTHDIQCFYNAVWVVSEKA